jgi:hypothetical protein
VAQRTGKDSDYYLLKADSAQVRVATRQRRVMYEQFVQLLEVGAETTILDVGVADDRAHGEATNYLENWHPYPHKITALGLGDASFLRDEHPGLTFVAGNGLFLPFRDQSFDVVHCAAVIEHVGTSQNQSLLVSECARVARRGFVITTPNRWFPVEVHTSIPLVHWFPKPLHRAFLSYFGYAYYCQEENLNLMDRNDFRSIGSGLADYDTQTLSIPLFCFTSNLMFAGQRIKVHRPPVQALMPEPGA